MGNLFFGGFLLRFLNKYSFKYVLFISISSLFIITLATIIFINYRVSIKEIVHLSASQQQTNVTLIKDSIEERLRAFEANAIVLSRQSSLNEVINNRGSYYQIYSLTNDFSNSVYSNGDLHSIEIFIDDPPTNNIQNPVRYYDLEKALTSPLIHRLDHKNADWIGIRTVEMISGDEPVISHARKIKNSRGQTQAILVLNLDPLIAESWLRSYPNESVLYLIDKHAHILASTNQTEIGQKYIPSTTSEELTDWNRSYFVNKDELVVTADLMSYDWQLVATTPYQQLTQSSKQAATRLLLFSLLITVFVLIAIGFLSNQLTKPIHQLTDLMNHYQLNRATQNIPNHYRNEFGHLFTGYKNLINRNEKLHKSLIAQHKQQKRAELKALQANINPHFLYNTLDQLNWRAIESGDDDMSEMIELLGGMLRVGLSNGKSILTIEEEVEYVKKYLKLQEIRQQGTFQYHIVMEEEVRHALIPKLTLQPFVENALIHGIQDIEDGLITITIRDKKNFIQISIKDNGLGADSFSKHKTDHKSGGYGIKNVKDRLNHYYHYAAKINITNRPEGGVEVILRIPKIFDTKGFSLL